MGDGYFLPIFIKLEKSNYFPDTTPHVDVGGLGI